MDLALYTFNTDTFKKIKFFIETQNEILRKGFCIQM